MRIISWNVRGLHDLDKCDKIRAFFKDYFIDIALLQEMKMECPDFRFHRRLEDLTSITRRASHC